MVSFGLVVVVVNVVVVVVVIVVVVPTRHPSTCSLSMVGPVCIVDLVYMTCVGHPAGVLHICPLSWLVPDLVTAAQVTLLCLALLANNHGTPVICLTSLGYQPCSPTLSRQLAERIELC